MPDVLLFGATGYTGRKTAHALARLGVKTVLAGRDPAKLEALAAEVDAADVRLVRVGNAGGLTAALTDVRVLLTCVGPFVELGDTAVEAALGAGVHYLDSAGEGLFIRRLIARDVEARAAGIAMAPAMGFDEVPADVIATLAAGDHENPELTLTYALPRTGSRGTVRSSLGILASRAPWIEDGIAREVGVGEELHYAPLPPPLGVRVAMSFPFGECYLAPLHLELRSLRTYVTSGTKERLLARLGIPVLRGLLHTPLGGVFDLMAARLPEAPRQEQLDYGKFTLLAEAHTRDGRHRYVCAIGADVYGLTAELLALGARTMASDDYDRAGVLSPVGAIGLDPLLDALERFGVEIRTFDSTKEGEPWGHDSYTRR